MYDKEFVVEENRVQNHNSQQEEMKEEHDVEEMKEFEERELDDDEIKELELEEEEEEEEHKLIGMKHGFAVIEIPEHIMQIETSQICEKCRINSLVVTICHY